MSIPLPPLPDEFLMHPTQGECYTADQLRARDLEIARVVLEAAARTARLCECDRYEPGSETRRAWNEGTIDAEDAIRALEFKHHE